MKQAGYQVRYRRFWGGCGCFGKKAAAFTVKNGVKNTRKKFKESGEKKAEKILKKGLHFF